ncbi:glycosyltransferase family 25 protein [Pseudohoeflea coraliihabitans]|uniref:Glycosyltransferase family 25 protein n=1 Tax=Pseudohoeflea coraliihabitans TaxID=2860393 RepID=A0ABS6WID6_9HYPH|nr:glycosyltransferase family 25 protein [Pseudohoeflea sp. DP4N28-3]MBW3095709.1 glycosyltransferase family 25 protein [Pseudohoeflea sp. DP4N28-3]
MQAYIIHLRNSVNRQQNVRHLQNCLPGPTHIVDAVAGAQLNQDDIDAVYQRSRFWLPYPFRLSRAEIACFLSHRKAWRAIVESGDEAAIIVEDDAQIDTDRFPEALRLVETFIGPRDIVRFPHKCRGRVPPLLLEGPSVCGTPITIRREISPGLAMIMQCVGRDAARHLLALTETFDRPVDVFLQMRWLHKLPVSSVHPVVVREISQTLGGSTIQTHKRPLFHKLGRNLSRAAYRSWVRTYNGLV